jgi:hypothetical protein
MRHKPKRKTALKKKSARAKLGVKRAVKASVARSTRVEDQHRDFIDGFMTTSAEALGLTIDPVWRDSVKFNLWLVLDHAARLEAFALADDAEPAPVFHA